MTRRSGRRRGRPSKTQVAPSTPAPAVVEAERDDPAETLAITLWNEGHKDEALAILEGQIAVEKTLTRAEAPLPSASVEPAVDVRAGAEKPRDGASASLTSTLWERWSKGDAAAAGVPRQDSSHRTAPIVTIEPAPKAATERPIPVVPVANAAMPIARERPTRLLGLLACLLVLLLGGVSLWIARAPIPTDITQEAANEPEGEALPAEAVVNVGDVPPVTARLDPVETSEDDASFPAGEMVAAPPAEELTDDTPPPAEELLEESEPPLDDSAGAAEPTTEAMLTPPQEPAARPAPDPPAATISRALAEKRAEAERYAARRRAAAEETARRRTQAPDAPRATIPEPRREPPLIGDGPAILLGGRGLP